MTVPGLLDDRSLKRYRELLDAEDAAFDELEHAYEDGNRQGFDAEIQSWQSAVSAKLAFLRQIGMEPAPLPVA